MGKKYDVFKFFEKLRRINEKYANPNSSLGSQKQLIGDAEAKREEESMEESDNSRIDFIRSEEGSEGVEEENEDGDDYRAEADSPINEGMLIVTKMCYILLRMDNFTLVIHTLSSSNHIYLLF